MAGERMSNAASWIAGQIVGGEVLSRTGWFDMKEHDRLETISGLP